MKNQIKELRVQIDGLAKLTKTLFPVEVSSYPRLEVNKDGIYIDDKSKSYHNSKEIDKAFDSLILAKAWLGKVLGALGEETPYKNDGNRKEVSDIENASDKKEFRDKGINYEFTIINNEAIYWKDLNHIQKVDLLREEIKKLDDITNPYGTYSGDKFIKGELINESMYYMINANRHIQEARFWLGFELERIKIISDIESRL